MIRICRFIEPTLSVTDEQELTRVYVKDYGDSALITTQSNSAMMIGDIARPDAWMQVVKITPTEIIVIQGKAKTDKGFEHFDGQDEILFKIPTRRHEVAEWSEALPKGAVKTVYRSKFATIKVGGKKVLAVKVSCVRKRVHSGKESVFYIDYYVAGMGRYKRSTENGFDIEVLAKQAYDPDVPELN